MTLPLLLRNRVAELILDALHDPGARAGLEALAEICADPRARNGGRALPQRFPADLFEARGGELLVRRNYRAHADELCERARRGCTVTRGQPFEPAEPSLEQVLRTAARLFDARLYFEVHEHLEPHWLRASGTEREALQGLIQIAVGLQHLANGNLRGARLLLGDGVGRLPRGRLAGVPLDAFGAALRATLERVAAAGDAARFDWSTVPRFPGRD